MRRFFAAALLLFAASFGAAAQNGVEPTATPKTVEPSSLINQTDTVKPLSVAEAIDLALKQVSAFRAAQIGERIAAEDVRQAKAAFYPRVGVAPNFIYTTPSLARTTAAGVTNGNLTAVTGRPPSFIGANAISEYQGLVTANGEIDISGRLRATLRRNRALVDAARAGGARGRRNRPPRFDERRHRRLLQFSSRKRPAARRRAEFAGGGSL